jgi:hypothetical protein
MDISTIILGIVVISRTHKHDILGWCSIVFVGIQKLGRIQLEESQIMEGSTVRTIAEGSTGRIPKCLMEDLDSTCWDPSR